MSGIFRQQEMCFDPSRAGGKRPRPLRLRCERVGKGMQLILWRCPACLDFLALGAEARILIGFRPAA